VSARAIVDAVARVLDAVSAALKDDKDSASPPAAAPPAASSTDTKSA
jgi:hypothetical protein